MKKKIIIGVLLVACGLGAGFFSLFAFAQVARDENYAADLRIRAAEMRAEEPTVMPGGIEVGPSFDQVQAQADAYLADAESADADEEVQTILAWSLVSWGRSGRGGRSAVRLGCALAQFPGSGGPECDSGDPARLIGRYQPCCLPWQARRAQL